MARRISRASGPDCHDVHDAHDALTDPMRNSRLAQPVLTTEPRHGSTAEACYKPDRARKVWIQERRRDRRFSSDVTYDNMVLRHWTGPSKSFQKRRALHLALAHHGARRHGPKASTDCYLFIDVHRIAIPSVSFLKKCA